MTQVLFGKKSKNRTNHRICPPIEDVFDNDHEVNSNWFLPLLSVELREINPNWNGFAHFVYYEANRVGGITFRKSDHKYSYSGPYGFDGEDMAERDKHSGFIELVPLEMPELTAHNNSEWVETVHTRGKLAGHRSLSYSDHFAACPYWTQSDETPLDPDGKPMQFVGQIRADNYSDEVAGSDQFLFYSPKHKLVTQIDQCT